MCVTIKIKNHDKNGLKQINNIKINVLQNYTFLTNELEIILN